MTKTENRNRAHLNHFSLYEFIFGNFFFGGGAPGVRIYGRFYTFSQNNFHERKNLWLFCIVIITEKGGSWERFWKNFKNTFQKILIHFGQYFDENFEVFWTIFWENFWSILRKFWNKLSFEEITGCVNFSETVEITKFWRNYRCVRKLMQIINFLNVLGIKIQIFQNFQNNSLFKGASHHLRHVDRHCRSTCRAISLDVVSTCFWWSTFVERQCRLTCQSTCGG